MIRALLVLIFAQALCAIDLGYFNSKDEVELLKDQRVFITLQDRNEKRLMHVRWTLFHNEGLVLLCNVNGFPSQHILYRHYRQDSVRFSIALRDEEKALYHPYVLITFLGYDYVTKKAKLLILHKDSATQTQIDIKIEK